MKSQDKSSVENFVFKFLLTTIVLVFTLMVFFDFVVNNGSSAYARDTLEGQSHKEKIGTIYREIKDEDSRYEKVMHMHDLVVKIRKIEDDLDNGILKGNDERSEAKRLKEILRMEVYSLQIDFIAKRNSKNDIPENHEIVHELMDYSKEVDDIMIKNMTRTFSSPEYKLEYNFKDTLETRVIDSKRELQIRKMEAYALKTKMEIKNGDNFIRQ